MKKIFCLIFVIALLCNVSYTKATDWTVEHIGMDYTNAVAYNGSICVAVGNNGAIVATTDFVNWTVCEINYTSNFNTVFCYGKYFVAIGSERKTCIENNTKYDVSSFFYSIDGLKWDKLTTHYDYYQLGSSLLVFIENESIFLSNLFTNTAGEYNYLAEKKALINTDIVMMKEIMPIDKRFCVDVSNKGGIRLRQSGYNDEAIWHSRAIVLDDGTEFSPPEKNLKQKVVLPKGFEDFGKENGYITTINGEQYYVNNYKRYYGYQKLYAREAFDAFRNSFKDLFQYEMTDNGYIVCASPYRINMQNSGWSGNDDQYTVYLYGNELKLLDSQKFDSRVYSVGYIDGFYIIEFVNGGLLRNDPINFTYKKSSDFTTWVDCDKPKKISRYDIIYESGVKFFFSNRLGDFYSNYNSEKDKTYISRNGIYSLEINCPIYANSVYWEDDNYLYIKNSNTLLKTLKQPFYDSLNALEKLPIIKLNDTIIAFKIPPVVQDDRILVPMRFLFEKMGAMVHWDNDTQTATVQKEGKEISFSIDSTNARVGSEVKTMDIPAKLINDKTMVPLRFLSEGLGYTVEWDGNTKTASINTK